MRWVRNVPRVERSKGPADHGMIDSPPNRIIDTSEEVKRMTEAEDEVRSSRWKNQLATSAIRPQRGFLACPKRLHERTQCWAGRAMNPHANDVASLILACQPPLDFVQVASLERPRALAGGPTHDNRIA